MKYKIVFCFVVIFALGGCWQNYSNGSRVGVPFKLSRKGAFCKTWEGTANLGGMRMESDGKTNSLVPNVWTFTIKDEDAARFNPIIENAIEKGKTLRFEYSQELIPICHSEDGYYVMDVKEVSK